MTDQQFNPYAAESTSIGPSFEPNPQGEASMVNQVTIIGILQIAMGALEILAGAGMVAMGFFMAFAMAEQPPGVEPPPELVVLGMQLFYWILGGLISLFAVMRISSGISSFWFRGRIWLIISLFGGLVSALTCYCAPFSIGLCIYGLIVTFSSGVVKAYQLGSQRVPPQEIKRRFAAFEAPVNAPPQNPTDPS